MRAERSWRRSSLGANDARAPAVERFLAALNPDGEIVVSTRRAAIRSAEAASLIFSSCRYKQPTAMIRANGITHAKGIDMVPIIPPAFLIVPKPAGDCFVCDRSQMHQATRAYVEKARIPPDCMLVLDLADATAPHMDLLAGREGADTQGHCPVGGHDLPGCAEWLRRGFIRASISGRVGSGGHLQFTPHDGFLRWRSGPAVPQRLHSRHDGTGQQLLRPRRASPAAKRHEYETQKAPGRSRSLLQVLVTRSLIESP